MISLSNKLTNSQLKLDNIKQQRCYKVITQNSRKKIRKEDQECHKDKSYTRRNSKQTKYDLNSQEPQ